MPATSRSGERLRRRSASGRAGSPSKSSTNQSPSAYSVWPRCRSPWWRMTRPPTATWREHPQVVADLLAAAGDLGGLVAVGEVEEDPLDLLVDGRGQQPERLGGRLLGRERGVAGVRAQHGVHRADDLAEAPDARRGSASGVACRARRARAPSRRGRRRRSAGACPSVASRLRPSISYQPARPGMCSKPCSVRKRVISRSGLMPGSTRRKTLRISSSPKTIDELDCSAPTGRGTSAGGADLGQRAGSG